MRSRKLYQGDELGADAAGQSGDIQRLPNIADADSESVEELAEAGNAFEASALAGFENAKDPDVAEVRTHEVPEEVPEDDDDPEEYLDQEDIA